MATKEVHLQSHNPLAAPGIDQQFLSDPEDLQVPMKCARLTRDLMGSPPISQYMHKEMFITDEPDDAELEDHIRSCAIRSITPVGTCNMGVDDMAVVGPDLKVDGLDGLRVVDASVMPTLISGNTNAPTIMITERAADIIRG